MSDDHRQQQQHQNGFSWEIIEQNKKYSNSSSILFYSNLILSAHLICIQFLSATYLVELLIPFHFISFHFISFHLNPIELNSNRIAYQQLLIGIMLVVKVPSFRTHTHIHLSPTVCVIYVSYCGNF
jgi:hypothetical protein